ncbi:MAG: hypothetical protein KatS3mg057_0981 [Herpetosiphonaceae bacterium]|nr:MAG: hypothetical protein KatS3mg057_0981 [Herpetosiphonaceae bacterium]
MNATLEAQATSQSARQVVLGMTLFALLLSVALGFPLASYIVTNLGRLISTTVAVAGGDLQRRVELRSRDELGMLAEHFNLMVSNLQQHQLLLEERNAALEASLLQQQQLMDDLIRGKRAEEAAYRAQAAAEAANRAKSEFLSRMSHELRTPMNAILGYAQLLQMQGLTPQQQKSVSSILKSGRHLLNLINEVLDIARIEAGHLPMSLEPIYLPALIDDVLDVISPLADQRRIHIENTITEQGDRYVLADYQRLKQVLLNLLSNAVKYNTEAGFVHLAYTEDAQGRLKVMVRDTGPGIASDEIGLLFTPFTRVGMESASIEGIGLGLALSKKMVEAMGGEIGVESELGRGSTFWIALNIAQPPVIESQDGAQSSTPVQSALPQTGTGVVLYIEDNIANVKLIEEVLVMRPGVRLLTAMQARLGVDLAFEHQPDLILLDLNLPDMDGEETLRQLRAHPKNPRNSGCHDERRCHTRAGRAATGRWSKPLSYQANPYA